MRFWANAPFSKSQNLHKARTLRILKFFYPIPQIFWSSLDKSCYFWFRNQFSIKHLFINTYIFYEFYITWCSKIDPENGTSNSSFKEILVHRLAGSVIFFMHFCCYSMAMHNGRMWREIHAESLVVSK